jgi:HD superfamily phosphohydrolase
MHLGGQFAEALGLPETERKAIRMAGLLHDIGHGPFSHATENADPSIDSHEEVSCQIVRDLGSNGVLPVSEDKIIGYINGKTSPSLIAGDIDADRMDYLKRDSHFTGIPHGQIDTQTIIKSTDIREDGSIIFHRRAIEALEQMLVSRKNMIGSVYTHPTAHIAENMLETAVANFQKSTEETFWTLDDYQLHTKLLNSTGISKNLYQKIINRKLYKTAFEVRRRHLDIPIEEFNINDTKLKQTICTELEIPEHKVFVDVTVPNIEKQFNIQIETKDGIYPFENLSGSEPLLTGQSGNTLLLSIQTPKNLVEDVQSVAKPILTKEIL